MATKDFTPTRPAMIQGQMHVRIGREAKDPLTLTALAIDGGRTNTIVISCDLAMVSEGLVSVVRQRLARLLPELQPEALIMTATHTHDSLVTEDGFYTHPGGDVMTPAECQALVADHAVEAAAEAWRARTPREVGRAFGHAVVGHNRRAVYLDGSARMYGQTNQADFSWIEGYEDHSLDMLPVWEPDGRLAGIVLAIPCPSQVEEQLSLFSADFWHDIRVELRRRYGPELRVVSLCGAAGDQSPHFLLYGPQEEEMRRRRGLSERQEIASRVGDAVSRALACMTPTPRETPFVWAMRRVELTAINITRSQRDRAEAEHQRCIQEGQDMSSWWPSRLRQVVETFDQGSSWPAVPVEIHGLRIGEVGIVTNPFELFLDYGLRIKARSPAAQTLVVQLAAGRGMYLPTERALRGGHYSAMPAVCQVGPEGGQELVETSLAMLRKLFSQ
jgi:hypothetical protein